MAVVKVQEERKKVVGDRTKIESEYLPFNNSISILTRFLKEFSGRPRSLKLALATEEQREQVKELLEVQKKEKEAILEGFKVKNKDMKICNDIF